MTIYELRGRAAELETEIEKILQEATKEFHKHECPRNIPYDKDYCDAWNKVVFFDRRPQRIQNGRNRLAGA